MMTSSHILFFIRKILLLILLELIIINGTRLWNNKEGYLVTIGYNQELGLSLAYGVNYTFSLQLIEEKNQWLNIKISNEYLYFKLFNKWNQISWNMFEFK